MDYCIITGASSGIGEALARCLIKPGNVVATISRTPNPILNHKATASQIPYYYIEADLSQRESAEASIQQALQLFNPKNGDRLVLINNAGMLEPVAPVKSIDFALAEKHLHLNLLAPIILTSAFLSRTEHLDLKKVVLNISSGAAFIPYYGWASYCSSKAGLDMFTKVAGEEQKKEKYPATIFALAPGIVETGMQHKIRQSDENAFPEKSFFVNLFKEGSLSKPEDIAEIITNTMFNPQIEIGSVIGIDKLKSLLAENSDS